MAYAKPLTKEDLIRYKITDVSEDGKHIYKNGIETKQFPKNKKYPNSYKTIMIYDPLLRQLVPKEERTNSSGQIPIDVHRVVYVWHHGDIPQGMVVDHIDNDKTNNHKDNLQLLTPYENVWKERPHNNYEMKCDMSRPRKYYEDKLSHYLAANEEAKAEGDAEKCHKLRSSISQYRAKLRFWDSHSNQYDLICKLRDTVNSKQQFKHDKASYIRNLEDLGKQAKEKLDFALWHECCDLKNFIAELDYDSEPLIKAVYKDFLFKHKKDFDLQIFSYSNIERSDDED